MVKPRIVLKLGKRISPINRMLSENTLEKYSLTLRNQQPSQTIRVFSSSSTIAKKPIVDNETPLDFEDFEKAFRAKSTREIVRALMVYKLCSFDFLVERNKTVNLFLILFTLINVFGLFI